MSNRNNIGFRFSSTQKERIRIAQAAGSRLDSSPTAMHEGTTLEKIMNLRPRQPDQEIGAPYFRYRPNNYLEKVTDALRYKNAVGWSSTKEVFAPNLLNKRGELAKNLKPLPANYDHAKRKRQVGSKEETEAAEGAADGRASPSGPGAPDVRSGSPTPLSH